MRCVIRTKFQSHFRLSIELKPTVKVYNLNIFERKQPAEAKRRLKLTLGTLRYWNADALKNALVEEGLDRTLFAEGKLS